MIERITLGRTIVFSDENTSIEPITINEVKAYMNISFNAHDAKLESLITSVREALEIAKGVTLITERTINVAWQQFYDFENLPFWPLKTGETITVTDLDGVVIDETEYKASGVGGFKIFTGDFPNGVKLSYKAAKGTISESVKNNMIKAVAMCFEKSEISPYQAVSELFKFQSIY